MSEKIGLSLLENNRIRILLNSNQAIEFELRRGEYGHSPYSDDSFVGIEITDNSEQQKILELATKCTQIMISFPMNYPDGYLEKRLEQLKNLMSNNS